MGSTQIIATIGRSCQRGNILLSMAKAGMDIARINFSHENERIHSERIRLVKGINARFRTGVKIFLDLKGPEVRLNCFKKPVELKKGKTVYLSSPSRKRLIGKRFKINNPAFIDKLVVGSKILIDDGYVELIVVKKKKQEVKCKTLNKCVIRPKKSVSSEFISLGQKAITPEDEKAIRFGVKKKVDYIALSHIRNAQDVEDARKLANGIPLISKIENFEAVNNIREIMNVSDGIVVARGDLGMNIPIELVPAVQERILKLCSREGKLSIVATQMMESMITHNRPTRAEVNDVFTAVRQGAQAVWLSGETAMGNHPVEVVDYMRRVVDSAESRHVVDFNKVALQARSF